jgi:hypothetical protein
VIVNERITMSLVIAAIINKGTADAQMRSADSRFIVRRIACSPGSRNLIRAAEGMEAFKRLAGCCRPLHRSVVVD